MGIASTKLALMSKPHLTLNKSVQKSACKHRELLHCARFANGDVSIGFRCGNSQFVNHSSICEHCSI
jgi:hypothetical protein